jgi:hypothetical protein
MATDVLITPSSGIIEFNNGVQGSLLGTLATMRVYDSLTTGNLSIQNSTTGANLSGVRFLNRGVTGNIFEVYGTFGNLLTIDDDLNDSIFSVNGSAGLPVLDIYANNTVFAGQYGQNDFVITGNRVGIGLSAPSAALHVQGTNVTTNAQFCNSTLGSIFQRNNANASGARNAITLRNTNLGTASSVDLGIGIGFELGYGGTVGSTLGTRVPAGYITLNQETNADWTTVANRFTYMQFATLNAGAQGERMRITSGGNVGIGTTTNLARLNVTPDASYPTIRINNSASGANDEIFQRWAYVESGNAYYLDLKQTVETNIVRYNFSMVNNGTAYNDVLVLDRGAVGIGVVTPLEKLHINTGALRIDGTTDGIRVFKNGADTVSSHYYLANATNTRAFNFQLSSSGNLMNLFAYNGTAWGRKFVFGNDGRLGVGDVNPSYALHVSGNVYSDNSRTATYTSVTTGPSGSWYPLFAIGDSTDASVFCSIRTFAHSSVSFIAAKGYGPSQTHAVSILNCQVNANGGYANVTGVRIRESGWVEIQLSWSSGPTVDFGVQIIGSNNTPTFAGSLAPTGAADAIVDTVSLANGMMRSRGNFEAAGGYIAANTTSPARPLTVNGDGTNPCIRLLNSTFATSTNTALYTFRGWLPIDIGTTKYYLQVFN